MKKAINFSLFVNGQYISRDRLGLRKYDKNTLLTCSEVSIWSFRTDINTYFHKFKNNM